MKCTQPGCSGTITDGYCDVCGMAPAEGASVVTAPQPSAAAAAPAADGTRCAQPGCAGTIADGYCDTCGMAADSPSTVATEAQPLSGGTLVRPAPSRAARIRWDPVRVRRVASVPCVARSDPKAADCTLLADVATESPPDNGWASVATVDGESAAIPQVSQ